MWIGVGGFGFYIGPLWASLWAYMGEYVEMSGTAGTVITIGSGFVNTKQPHSLPFLLTFTHVLCGCTTRLGSIIAPTVVGQMMDKMGPDVLLYQQLICCFGLLLMLIGIILMTRYAVRYIAKKRMALAFSKDGSGTADSFLINDVTGSQPTLSQ